METILDDSWIVNFNNMDKLYKDFYKDNLYYINIRSIYINRDNEIEKIKQESVLLKKNNEFSRDELLGILKRNSILHSKKYTLLSILKYNITLDPGDIQSYLKSNIDDNYLTIVKNIDTILFEKSISMLDDLNDLIFIFYEKDKIDVKNNCTKKIYLQKHKIISNHKKTIRRW